MPAIGVLTLELKIEESHSLKEKRHVVKSLKDRIRHKYNVSVAEIDYLDQWQRALLSVVTVSASRQYADGLLRCVEDEVASLTGQALIEATIEWIE